MTDFALSKRWRIEQVDDNLVITGGQDAIYTIALDSTQPSFFADLEKLFSEDQLTPSDKLILEQLLSAGIIVPTIEVTDPVRPNIKVLGDAKIIETFVSNDNYFSYNSERDTDLLILIRSNETFSEFLDLIKYTEISCNHIFVDLAYNHVISLGPLVFPGITSCVGCLKGRLESRWGDAKPPEIPTSSADMLDFTREWLKQEVKKLYEQDDYILANKTIVFDSQDRTMTQNKLLTVPLCPYCKKGEVATDGKIDLQINKEIKA